VAQLDTLHLVAAVWRDGADAAWELELMASVAGVLPARRVAYAEGRADIDYAAVFGMLLGFERWLVSIAKGHDIIVNVPGIDA